MESRKGKLARCGWLIALLLAASLALISACGNHDEKPVPGEASPNDVSQPKELLVSAAASLREVLTAILQDYRQENPGVEITFNFGSSGTLQRQIEQGAPVDIFISAGKKQMDELEKQDLILSETREDLLSNELVLITGQNNEVIASLEDLEKDAVSTIALGIPESSPAGQYTKEALINLQLWEALEDKFVMAKDVKQVLTYVETGNADAGFVYHSDALGLDKVKIVASLSPELHGPIVYPAAIIKEAQNKEEAQAFLAYLKRKEVREIFEEYGFKSSKGGA